MSEKWKEAPDVLQQIRQRDSTEYFLLNHNIFLGKLHDNELFWVKVQPYLLANGFQLRPRFRPEWIPSWRDRPHERLKNFEDSIPHYNPRFIDAVRLSDGSQVVIKVVHNTSVELPIIQYLSSSACRADKRNRTVPVHAILPAPNDHSKVFLVMPLLSRFDELPFRHFGEVVEALEQFLQVKSN
ncbi:hypothetical protein C0995_002524 [Termitomyces sp. Mi166|nr:hypothetical protein C0995_002524 [Termitomyces sp. Mi166\